MAIFELGVPFWDIYSQSLFVCFAVSTTDAMEIADDDSPLVSKIPVGLPNVDPLQNADLKKSNAYNSSPQQNRQVTKQDFTTFRSSFARDCW